MRVGCLHTVEGNIRVFEAALQKLGEPDTVLDHALRPDLLAAAEQAGGLTPEIEAETERALRRVSEAADVVLLTCSTLGPVADRMQAAVPVMRVDAALARQAVSSGGRVVALCAVETTVAPTRRLFESAASATGAKVEALLVPGAWSHFKSGDRETYLSLVADAVQQAYARGADVVALAQASMAPAAGIVRYERPPLTSPTCGLAGAIALARARSAAI